MVNLSKEQFEEKKKNGKIFSIISEYRGDEVTPIRIFNGFRGKRRFIFESGSTENYSGRYSFLGEDPYKEIIGETKEKVESLKNEIRINFDILSNKFPFKGGAIGYMGYETAGFYESKLKFKNHDDLNLPLIRFNIYKRYIAYDHFTNKVFIVDNIFKDDEREYELIKHDQRNYILNLLRKDTNIEDFGEKEEIRFVFLTSKEKYEDNVSKIKKHILQGDIFQAVPSLRMKCKTNKSYIEIYRNLREINPSPYMYLIDYEEYVIIGSSQESIVSVKDGIVSTKPIAGTRKRGINLEEDSRLEKELMEDKKELAEHVMLVDLARNDIGRISKIGSVQVNDFMKIEKFSHVMHITSTVKGNLLDNLDGFDALSSCLPAGTLSGAPKIRAMEIIEDIEEYRRGIYGGSVGYFSFGGDTDMAIAISTMVIKKDTVYLQAGSGIVYDSIPKNEFYEVQNKLMGLREALR